MNISTYFSWMIYISGVTITSCANYFNAILILLCNFAYINIDGYNKYYNNWSYSSKCSLVCCAGLENDERKSTSYENIYRLHVIAQDDQAARPHRCPCAYPWSWSGPQGRFRLVHRGRACRRHHDHFRNAQYQSSCGGPFEFCHRQRGEKFLPFSNNFFLFY